MYGRWYGQQGYPQWCPPQGYPRQGYPPQYGGFAQEEYSNNAYGYPPQGYNNPYAQPPQGMNENKPQIKNVKKIDRDGDLNMGANAGVECNYEDMNQQPHNPFAQANWGKNEPIIEHCEAISGKGKFNMGTNSGSTISYGKRAPK